MEIKDIIKNRRLETGLTMKEVAAKVGVSEATISRWESGDIANMRRDKIVLLARALSISPSVIMGWEDKNKLDLQIFAEPDTGKKVTDEEMDIIEAYRDASQDTKRAVRVILNVQEHAHPVVYYTNVETANAAQEAFDKHRILFDAARDVPVESIQEATELLQKFKETNPDG